MRICRAFGCTNDVSYHHDFCPECDKLLNGPIQKRTEEAFVPQSMSQKYPKYYKEIGELTEVDVYAVHYLFDIQDPSGAIQHASKKLLLSGVRTGGKTMFKDITEARDTLTRWLELNADKS